MKNVNLMIVHLQDVFSYTRDAAYKWHLSVHKGGLLWKWCTSSSCVVGTCGELQLKLTVECQPSIMITPRRSRSAAAYSRKLSHERSVGRSVRMSICPVHCAWTNGDRFRMPFGIIGRTGPGMRQVLGLGIGPREVYFWGRIWGTPL